MKIWNNYGRTAYNFGKVLVCDDCPCSDYIIITYYFEGGRDLDTQTKLSFEEGEGAGWSCSYRDGYVDWRTGDNTGSSPEIVFVDLAKMRSDGVLYDEEHPDGLTGFEIKLHTCWYRTASPSGNARIVVEWRGTAVEKIVSAPDPPLRDCCTHHSATVKVDVIHETVTLE